MITKSDLLTSYLKNVFGKQLTSAYCTHTEYATITNATIMNQENHCGIILTTTSSRYKNTWSVKLSNDRESTVFAHQTNMNTILYAHHRFQKYELFKYFTITDPSILISHTTDMNTYLQLIVDSINIQFDNCNVVINEYSVTITCDTFVCNILVNQVTDDLRRIDISINVKKQDILPNTFGEIASYDFLLPNEDYNVLTTTLFVPFYKWNDLQYHQGIFNIINQIFDREFY